MDQALFVLSEDGILSLAKEGDIANVFGCYISSANVCDHGVFSGWIERPVLGKKISDGTGILGYEFLTESLDFYFESKDFGELLEIVLDHAIHKKYFNLKVNNALAG